jgi:hypothetical protein
MIDSASYGAPGRSRWVLLSPAPAAGVVAGSRARRPRVRLRRRTRRARLVTGGHGSSQFGPGRPVQLGGSRPGPDGGCGPSPVTVTRDPGRGSRTRKLRL